MTNFQRIPSDTFEKGDRIPFALYVEEKDKLRPMTRKNTLWNEHFMEYAKQCDLYIKDSDLKHFYRYASVRMERILNHPDIPVNIKSRIFYSASSSTMKKVLDDPRTETIAELKSSVRSLIKNIMSNSVIMEDLFRITSHDYYTYTHSINVGIFASALALKYYGGGRIEWDSMIKFCYGFFLHDIGKSRVPAEILNKPAKLTKEEWVLVKQHPQHGYNILMQTGHLTDEAAYITLEHHEQYDGSGYPYARKGNEIHPCARICAVADTFDALTTERPYKKALSTYDALKIMQQDMVFDFDYDMLQTFIKMLGPKH